MWLLPLHLLPHSIIPLKVNLAFGCLSRQAHPVRLLVCDVLAWILLAHLPVSMPRPKVPGAPEPKRRSRHGCWYALSVKLCKQTCLLLPVLTWARRACKAKKVKCGEEKPRCQNCDRNGEAVCDYSIRLQWDGRPKRSSKGASASGPGETSGGMGEPARRDCVCH